MYGNESGNVCGTEHEHGSEHSTDADECKICEWENFTVDESGRCSLCREMKISEGFHSLRVKFDDGDLRATEVEGVNYTFNYPTFKTLVEKGIGAEIELKSDMTHLRHHDYAVLPRVGDVVELEYLIVGSPEDSLAVGFEVVEEDFSSYTGIVRDLDAVGSEVSR